MEKQYNHCDYEKKIYKMWEDGGYFKAEIDLNKKPYTILLPPPNASGKMHTGNVLMIAIEDLLIRWKRMQGYAALWIPGTDHAGFETQITFEKQLAEKGDSRLNYDRQTLYNMIWEFVQGNKHLIENQIKEMGASVDWNRYTFTLDDKVIRTVYETFSKLHNDGLIYKDDYMVNYCTFCGTTFADAEVSHKTKISPLYYVKYQLVDITYQKKAYIVIATTRPETIYVDTHVAINPSDTTKTELIGKKVLNPLTENVMDIVADEFVDPKFGTGIVKLTPAHDKNDYEVAKKINLPIIQVFGMDGKMNSNAREFEGLYIKQAREKVVEQLIKSGKIDKIDENYVNTVALCKGKHQIEPMIIPNWFVKVDSLKKPAHEAVKDGRVTIYPKWQEIKYHRWMETMHDWPISRQVVWGIRIPVWYEVSQNPNLVITFLTEKRNVITGKLSEILKDHALGEIKNGLQTLVATKDSKYVISSDQPGENYLPETDTFDTWFSSGQWPLVTLGYPESLDFKYFYPTAVLETGWEILRLWISRMIMFGLYLANDVPFKNVYLHGMVRAIDGRKMSKSLGNNINPDEYIKEYGVDALRMGLIAGTANGKDFNFPHDKVKSYRNFANKIWNIARFMNMLFEEFENEDIEEFDDLASSPASDEQLNINDRNILKLLDETINKVDSSLNKYRFSDASEAIYHYIWNEVASNYIEDVKLRKGNNKRVGLIVLKHVFLNSMKLLHPFMPFVTEAVWQETTHKSTSPLIISTWPTSK
ncbi:valine--tRNA ligase [Candidatus Woesebacteria bacterium]|nr:MAG: valine--tRNA ligase [Candidatus Woesebacteria bacterium]